MKLHVAHLPRLIVQRRSAAVLGTIIIAMLWIGIVVKYSERVRTDQSEAVRTNENFAMVFEENVLRSLSEIETAIFYLRQNVEAGFATSDYPTILRKTEVRSELLLQLSIVDASGIIRASTVGPQPTPPVDLSDRTHFRIQKDGTDDRLYISKPVVGRVTNQWSVQLTRRFNRPDGSFGGILVASLDPLHFTRFYDKIDLGLATSIAMIGSDGIVRSSGGGDGRFALGENLKGTPLFGRMQQGSDTNFEYRETPETEPFLMTLRKVSGYPLWLTVGARKSDVLQPSWESLKWNGLAGLVLTLIILGAMEQMLRSEARAQQKAEQLKLTLEHMNQGIMLVTKDGAIPVINKKCGELLDLSTDIVDGKRRVKEFPVLKADGRTNSANSADIERYESTAVSADCEISEHIGSDGAVIEVRSTPLPDGGMVQTFTDVTKRRQAESYIARLASEDPLTGLPNRRVFGAAIETLSGGGGEADASAAKDFAVLFLDLDRFKAVNDTLGHRVGDMLLIEVAQRLQKSLSPDNVSGRTVLARLGGDEFAIVLPEFSSPAEIEALARIIAEAINQPYEIDGHRIRSSVSIGIAIGPRDGKNADDILMAADLALYAVKTSGRGTYLFYQPAMNQEVNDRRQIEMDLREAIEQNRLHLEYQPIVDLRRNVVVGFEALARWRHSTRGAISPVVFIPIAEDSGLILPLGEWALREACRQAAHWPAELKIAVNLSPVQFSLPNFADIVLDILAETGLAPERLVLEITERLFISDIDKALTILHRLKGLGIGIAMDDFGIGYSSLSLLRSFPFDRIKIDRSFVTDLGEDTQTNVIVQAVIIIARSLGMTTVAEGVESAGQQRLLMALGCDAVQGYFYSPAVPIERVPALIAEWSGPRVPAAKKIKAA
jgi:diguanylate cyclase (GGDEF)-like protein